MVAFTVFETVFPWVRRICDYIKYTFGDDVITVVGGYYPTLAPIDVLAHQSIDIVIRGEGEQAMLDIARNISVGNLVETHPLVEDLDTLPFWDREMFDYQKHINLSQPRNVKVMVGRGCPYQCSYCANMSLRSLYVNNHRYVRMRSVGNVIDELFYLKEEYDFDYVDFQDDTFTLFPKWLKEFCKQYDKDIYVPFSCTARVENCTDEILGNLKSAGCRMILLGLESGDDNYRNQFLNRKMTNKQIVNACKKIKDYGIMLWTFNMVGMPCETTKDIFQTIKLNWKIQPDFASTTVYYPFKGTPMGDACYKHGMVDLNKKRKVNSYADTTVLKRNSVELKLAKYLNLFSAWKSRFFRNEVFRSP